mgnify:FL=1
MPKIRAMIIVLHGRSVLRIESPEARRHKCTDCYSDARYTMYEAPERSESSWFWCGKCDIGG